MCVCVCVIYHICVRTIGWIIYYFTASRVTVPWIFPYIFSSYAMRIEFKFITAGASRYLTFWILVNIFQEGN